MVKNKWIFLLLFVCQTALADGWFCEQDAGKRTEDGFWVCGMGEALQEGVARANAQSDALRSFHQLCGSSSDCVDAKTSVVPERTSCKQDRTGIWKCHRLLIIYLGGMPVNE